MDFLELQAETVAVQMVEYLRATDALDTCFPQPLGFDGDAPDPYQYRLLVSPSDRWTIEQGIMCSPCWLYRETAGGPIWIREYKTLIMARNDLELLSGCILTTRALPQKNADGSRVFYFEERSRPYPPEPPYLADP